MAQNVNIGGSGTLFIGEDKTIRLEVFDIANPAVSIDGSGWATIFDVRLKDSSPDPAILSVVPSITGIFNAVRTSNTQRWLAPLTDVQLNLFRAKSYRWSWKRTDHPETVLAWGNFSPQKATAP